MQSWKEDINVVADYICAKLMEQGNPPSVAKLHKLLYYVQAWSMTFSSKALFDDEFEAWTFGPICPTITKRFKHIQTYLEIPEKEINFKNIEKFSDDAKELVDKVLEKFGSLSVPKIDEFFIQSEKPWIDARAGQRSTEFGNRIIPKEAIRDFHKSKPKK